MGQEFRLNDELGKSKAIKNPSKLINVTLLSPAIIKKPEDIQQIWASIRARATSLTAITEILKEPIEFPETESPSKLKKSMNRKSLNKAIKAAADNEKTDKMQYLKGKAIMSSGPNSNSNDNTIEEGGYKLDDAYIVKFCKGLGIDILPVDEWTIPKFKISYN